MNASEQTVDMMNLEIRWQKLSSAQKASLVASSESWGPVEAINAVLLGMKTHQLSVRTQARSTLAFIRDKLHSLQRFSNDSDAHENSMKTSACVCARILSQMAPGTPPEELRLYFNILVSLKGAGPMFAFRALYLNYLDIDTVHKLVLTHPDEERLYFIGEYLKADPGLRRRFGPALKAVAESIKKTDSAVTFFAGLFDSGQGADPFLNNIPFPVRDPEKITADFVYSQSPSLRERGLKALAMTDTGISPQLLTTILRNDPELEVRKTVYRIIETSALGTYPDLFEPLLDILKHKEHQEAVFAFKALIVSGKQPLYEVLEIVQQNHPGLLGHIYREISELSRISFFFIQDIALNPDIYRKMRIEINLAAVFGMIKKRPERVVHILKKYADKEDNSIAGFIKKTDQLLTREKKSMVAEFAAISRAAGKKRDEPKGLLSNLLFSDSLPRKIKGLIKADPNTSLDFENELFVDTVLSKITCSRSAANFNKAVFKNCRISKAFFFNCFFKETVFIDTDLSHCTFDSVSFQGAVFINVNADNAVFKNCNFHNFKAYNTRFNHARLPGASFIGATLSNCRFKGTSFSGACFAFSRLAVLSFEEANMDQVDLSYIRARFCRFPFHARMAATNDTVALNARQYQLELDDMPTLSPDVIFRINLLIFSEFIHYGEQKFFHQNRQSLLTAYDIFKSRQADLFMMIPYLLHQNVTLPGFNTKCHPATPHGIYDYYADPETLAAFARYNKGGSKLRPVASPAIEGLYTIGSIGSVAQTDDSDIDYWVCIRKEKLSGQDLSLLEQKLHTLETYAMEQFRIQVTFFIVDIANARDNHFGESTVESSGSAQALLLKEEFYRTMIHVAGKLPLWSVLPTAVSKAHYTPILKVITALPGIERHIDLGDIHTIPAGEFFGATVWQLFKGLKSPFKSVIKIALLEKYIDEAGKKPLLCNSVKDEWMNSGGNLRLAQNDSYYILLKNLLEYYRGKGDTESAWMLLTCFFLKLGILDSSAVESGLFGLREMLLSKCLKKWQWSKEQLFKTGRYQRWPYKKINKLSSLIESFMLKKYKRINKTFSAPGQDHVRISPEDRTVLGRKVYAELSRQPGKISKTLLISGRNAHFHTLAINYQAATGNSGSRWELTSRQAGNRKTTDTILQALSIEQIGAWLLLNNIYRKSLIINLMPNPTPVTADDLRLLFNAMYTHFAPVLKQAVAFDQLLKKSSPVSLFVSINTYASKLEQTITDYCAVYLNSWGELFSTSWASPEGMRNMDDAVAHFKRQIHMETLPLNTRFYTRGKPNLFNLYRKKRG